MKKRTGPKFTQELTAGTLSDISADERSEAAEYKDETCIHDLEGVRFSECTFSSVSFRNACACEYLDAVFDHCDFSNCDLSESAFVRTVFSHCRLTGTILIKCSMQDVLFDNCTLDYANLSSTRWKTCEMRDCRLDEASLSQCRFRDTDIEHCSFISAEFINTPLKDLDFSDSEISGIMVTKDCIPGVKVSQEQALELAKLLGIIVKE